MSSHRALILAFASTLFLGGIAACADQVDVDDLAGDSAIDGTGDGKADSGSDSTYTFYTIEHDQRRCVSPLCGGYWVARANRTTTTCADGKSAERCYVAELDLAKLGLADDQVADLAGAAGTPGKVLFRGSIAKKTFGSFGKLGVFKATEAYQAATDAPADGVFVRVKDMGVRCIAAPCLSMREDKLNSSLTATIANLDFEPTGASDDQIQRAIEAEFHGGLLMVGDRYYVSGAAGRAKARHVNQFYLPVLPKCFVGGCSAQVCSDQPGVITTCQWKAEYACYADATCERQGDGTCGWTQTDELQVCVADAQR